MDASWWLTNSCGEVRIIIVITFTLAAEKLAIEKWKLVASNDQITRSCPAEAPGLVTRLEISRAAADSLKKKKKTVISVEQVGAVVR